MSPLGLMFPFIGQKHICWMVPKIAERDQGGRRKQKITMSIHFQFDGLYDAFQFEIRQVPSQGAW
jgi:hypothetical protein